MFVHDFLVVRCTTQEWMGCQLSGMAHYLSYTISTLVISEKKKTQNTKYERC